MSDNKYCDKVLDAISSLEDALIEYYDNEGKLNGMSYRFEYLVMCDELTEFKNKINTINKRVQRNKRNSTTHTLPEREFN